MKKALVSLLLLLFLGFLSGCAVEKRPKPDYLALMVDAVVSGETETGRTAQRARDEELYRTGSDEAAISFDELALLARFLSSQAGDHWRTEEIRLCAGEVLLNRVASPEFPDTLAEVLTEAGGVPDDATSTRECAAVALRLLQGERLLDPKVVYLGDRAVGGGVYATFCDRRLRFTYFCLTKHPELYESPFAVDVPG